MLEVFEPGALNYFTFFRPILLTLYVSRNPILTHLPFSEFFAATHGGVIIFVRQSLSLSELSTSSLSSLDPYSDYVGVNNSPRCHFLMCNPPYSLLSDGGRTDSSPPRNLFILGDFNCHHPLWDSRGTSDPRGEEVFDWVISSDLPLNDSDTPILLYRSSGCHSSPDIHLLCSLFCCPFFLLVGALGPGFWPSTNSSHRPSLSGLSPQQASPFLQLSESLLE